MLNILKTFRHAACAGMAAICMVGVIGCEKEVDVTEKNLQGAWRAPFADATVTISLYPDNTYSIEADRSGETGGQQLYLLGAFGKIPPGGGWRLGDDEIVFSEGGRTVGGLEIVELKAENILLKADDGSAMYFDRKNLAGTSAFGGGGAPTGWNDEDMDDELGDEDMDLDDEADDTDPADVDGGATTRPAGN